MRVKNMLVPNVRVIDVCVINASVINTCVISVSVLQGYLAYKKRPPPRTLQQAYSRGPTVVLWKGAIPYERGTPVWGVRLHVQQLGYKGTSLIRNCPPRQSLGGGKSLQNRLMGLFPLLTIS